MPLTLALTPGAPHLTLQDHRPLWRRLHAIADTARGQFQTLWQTVFQDFRRGLTVRRVREALQSHSLFALETLWRAQWAAAVEQPVRQFLPLLVAGVVTESAQTSLRALALLTEEDIVPYTAGLPATQQTVETYVGQQLRLIGGTTVIALRQAVRWSLEQPLSPTSQRVWLQMVAGLTPRQVQTLEGLWDRGQERGTPQSQTVVQMQQAAALGVMQRVQGISETQPMASVNLGVQDAVEQTVRRGLLRLDAVRRYWVVTPDERLCQRCVRMAAMNAQGVGLYEPFQSVEGALMTPPRHVRCRCVVTIR